jgi:hypothetical protein
LPPNVSPLQSITSSARNSRDIGVQFRLSWRFCCSRSFVSSLSVRLGCRRDSRLEVILSTKTAARRNISGKSTP